MAKLKVFQFPDVVLLQKATPIDRVEKSLYSLADDMLETMYDAPGVGLAANQVGILQQMLVVDTEYDLADEEDENPANAEVVHSNKITNKKPKILINPQILSKEGSIIHPEGCLSVPEYYADVKRFKKIKVSYQTIDGITETLSAEGLMAVAIQHEMDHLNGKLFIDRLSPLKKEMVKKQLRQQRRERDSIGSGYLSSTPSRKRTGF